MLKKLERKYKKYVSIKKEEKRLKIERKKLKIKGFQNFKYFFSISKNVNSEEEICKYD